MLHNPTVIGATLLQLGKADAMLCGLVGPYASHLSNIKEVIGVQPCVPTPATVMGSCCQQVTYSLQIPLLTITQPHKN